MLSKEEAASQEYIKLLLMSEHFDPNLPYSDNDPDDYENDFTPKQKLRIASSILLFLLEKKSKIKQNTTSLFLSGLFSDYEEVLFLEGLELYGRNWKMLESHMKTRDSKSIRSHAQKHFIKLFRDDKPLPLKVAESGKGYTLSGKELDPYSASSRGYLGLKKLSLVLGKENHKISNSQIFTIADFIDQDPVHIISDSNNSISNHSSTTSENITRKKRKDSGLKRNSSTFDKLWTKELTISDFVDEDRESISQIESPSTVQPIVINQTEGFLRVQPIVVNQIEAPSRVQPKRKAAVSSKNSFSILKSTSDPHTLIQLSSYQENSQQPFQISVSPQATAHMDLHAHLYSKVEVIGLLGGRWDLKTKKLSVEKAFPCRSTSKDDDNSDFNEDESMEIDDKHLDCKHLKKQQRALKVATSRHTNVEMDPTSEVECRSKIRDLNMEVVGWYHSHPSFKPNPSIIDVDNQANYQRLFKVEGGVDEPFVGAIIAPFDSDLDTPISAMNWFYVDPFDTSSQQGFPKRMNVDVKTDKSRLILKSWFEEISEMVECSKSSSTRTNFSEVWDVDGEIVSSRLDKTLKSLKYWLVGNNCDVEEMLKGNDDLDVISIEEVFGYLSKELI